MLRLCALTKALHVAGLQCARARTRQYFSPINPSVTPRLKFINKASKLADTAITPSKINPRARGKREPLCARVSVCACTRARAHKIIAVLCRLLRNLFGQLLNVLVPPQRLRKPRSRCIFYKLAFLVYHALSPSPKLCLHTDTQPRSCSG